MKAPRYSFFTLSCWSIAACGGCIAIGNLLGLTGTTVPVFPPVDHLGGLLATSLLFFALGMVPQLFPGSSRSADRS